MQDRTQYQKKSNKQSKHVEINVAQSSATKTFFTQNKRWLDPTIATTDIYWYISNNIKVYALHHTLELFKYLFP